MEFSVEGYKVTMEFAHGPLAKVYAQGVTSLRAAKVHGVSRSQVNPL